MLVVWHVVRYVMIADAISGGQRVGNGVLGRQQDLYAVHVILNHLKNKIKMMAEYFIVAKVTFLLLGYYPLNLEGTDNLMLSPLV